MKYKNCYKGVFLERPNRFIAMVEIDGEVQRVHVKNTGRCKELLTPGCSVYLEKSDAETRKTAYDLVAVEKAIPGGVRLINMDSQAPNRMAAEWLAAGGLGELEKLRAEVRVGESRLDFAGEQDGRKVYIEVKGCTLEKDGLAMFPDAPTERGLKHVRELERLAQEGHRCIVLIVIQMKGVHLFRPNWATHPQFGHALRSAHERGVEIVAMDCSVQPGETCIDGPVGIDLSMSAVDC